MANIKALRKVCKPLIPQALVVMEEEYNKPDRVKLTHFWLAEKLNIKNGVAYVLLTLIAYKKKFCVRIPNGPIYWDNALVPLGVVMDLIKERKIEF